MADYIATFHTHIAAIRTHRTLKALQAPAQLSPVPRYLSSSCGTCVRYTAPEPLYDPEHDEMERLVICNDDGTYTQIMKGEPSADQLFLAKKFDDDGQNPGTDCPGVVHFPFVCTLPL